MIGTQSPISVEICIHATDEGAVRHAVGAAYRGGADRIELCGKMEEDGLTPSLALVEVARKAFQDRPGVLVMLRPRGGAFHYTQAEVDGMIRQMADLKLAGADGVVLGVLRAEDQQVDHEAMQHLMVQAQRLHLPVTFHRAFDAVPDRRKALAFLMALGVGRILTAGVPWGQPGSVMQGIPQLAETITQANGQLEVVLGGGVQMGYVPALLAALPDTRPLSLHAYSGAQVHGVTDEGAVRALVEAVHAG